MSIIISLSIWKEACTIASGLVLRTSTSEGPEENKELSANLIIISHLFRELMWCLRCHAALFLSHSVLCLSSLMPLHFSVSLTLILFFLFALCRGSALTRGAFMKSFQGSMWRSEMSFSDQMSLKQGLSYHFVRSTSLALRSVSCQLSQTQPLSEITYSFLVFFPLMFYKENYPVYWTESRTILQLDFFHSDIHHLLWWSKSWPQVSWLFLCHHQKLIFLLFSEMSQYVIM